VNDVDLKWVLSGSFKRTQFLKITSNSPTNSDAHGRATTGEQGGFRKMQIGQSVDFHGALIALNAGWEIQVTDLVWPVIHKKSSQPLISERVSFRELKVCNQGALTT
jgi:hypothetical protein